MTGLVLSPESEVQDLKNENQKVRTSFLLPALVFRPPVCFHSISSLRNAHSRLDAFQISHRRRDLNTVYFLDSKRGWVGGDGRFLSRTDDGGQSWVRENVGYSAAINDIYFRDK